MQNNTSSILISNQKEVRNHNLTIRPKPRYQNSVTTNPSLISNSIFYESNILSSRTNLLQPFYMCDSIFISSSKSPLQHTMTIQSDTSQRVSYQHIIIQIHNQLSELRKYINQQVYKSMGQMYRVFREGNEKSMSLIMMVVKRLQDENNMLRRQLMKYDKFRQQLCTECTVKLENQQQQQSSSLIIEQKQNILCDDIVIVTTTEQQLSQQSVILRQRLRTIEQMINDDDDDNIQDEFKQFNHHLFDHNNNKNYYQQQQIVENNQDDSIEKALEIFKLYNRGVEEQEFNQLNDDVGVNLSQKQQNNNNIFQTLFEVHNNNHKFIRINNHTHQVYSSTKKNHLMKESKIKQIISRSATTKNNYINKQNYVSNKQIYSKISTFFQR